MHQKAAEPDEPTPFVTEYMDRNSISLNLTIDQLLDIIQAIEDDNIFKINEIGEDEQTLEFEKKRAVDKISKKKAEKMVVEWTIAHNLKMIKQLQDR